MRRYNHPSYNQDIVYVEKGWGSETWHRNTDLYCGKTLKIHPFKKLSLHFHSLKDETFLITKGIVQLICYDDQNIDQYATSWEKFYEIMPAHDIFVALLVPSDTFHIPVGRRHTLLGLSEEGNELIEFSSKHFDSDSYRVLKGD